MENIIIWIIFGLIFTVVKKNMNRENRSDTLTSTKQKFSNYSFESYDSFQLADKCKTCIFSHCRLSTVNIKETRKNATSAHEREQIIEYALDYCVVED